MTRRRWPAEAEVRAAEAIPLESANARDLARSSDVTPRRPRPVERLFKRGPRSLSATDLIGLVVRSGGGGGVASDLGGRLLRRHGLACIARMSPARLLAEPGLGRANAARLAALFELGRRAWGDPAEPRPRVASPLEAWKQVRHLGRLRKEHLVGLYLDTQNGLLHKETISVGSLNTTRTHPREILYPAVEHLALGFILAHNHPSGCREPSVEDIEFTRGVHGACELMGIDLYDHLIVTRDGYTSLRERGVL